MFCPVCKAEYRAGFTRCSECDAELVDTLPSEELPNDLALAWRGSDPAAFSAALAALRDAAIPNCPVSDHDQSVFGLALPRPRYGLLVPKVNLERALECLEGISERSPFALGETPAWALEDNKKAEPGSSSVAEDQAEAPDDIAPEFEAKDATAEVWAGERGETAQMLQACLRENGIGCVVDDSGGNTRIRVLPESEARAREIIREVVEATPPE